MDNYALAVLVLVALLSITGVSMFFLGQSSSNSTQIQSFDVMTSISGASLDTSSGSVSTVGLNLTSVVLDTTNQTGDETVNYSITISQDSATVTSGGGVKPSGYGDESISISGSSQASNTGDESYGSRARNDLNLSLTDAKASNLARNVSVDSGQTINFNYSVSSSAEILSESDSVLDSVSGGTDSSTLVVSDISASISSFSLSGSLTSVESSTVSGSLNINPPVSGQEVISKNSDGIVIDTAVTDSQGEFSIESVSSGTILANVEGFEDVSSISNIDNPLYTSKEVSVSSVKQNGGINLSSGVQSVITLSNATGSKVDVSYNSDTEGTVTVSNPWQLKGMSKISNNKGVVSKEINTDSNKFVKFNNGSNIKSYENIDTGEDKIEGISNLSVTWIDVGQADSILLTSKNGENMLVDSGGFQDNGQTVIDYLNKTGVKKIHHLIGTHQDADHIGGHEKIINTFGSSGIGNVYDNGNSRTTGTYQEYINAVSNNNLSITEVSRGDTIPFDGANVEVLNPKNNTDSGSSGSDNDVVALKVSQAGNSIFLGGDIESESESRIVDAEKGSLDVEVMDVPHHGSSTSSSNKLLDELDPQFGFVSAPFDSQFGHPDDVVINRYENRGTDLFWTAANGNVTTKSSTSGIQTSIERGSVNDVTKSPNYELSVQNIPNSVNQGSEVKPDIQISNNGNVTDIQDITMTASGQIVDEEVDVRLVESQSTSFTLSWNTDGFATKDYTLVISTEDDSISRTVTVNGSEGGTSNLSDSIQNPSFESTGGWDFSDTDVQRSSDASFDGNFSASMKDLTQGYDGRILESNKVNVTGNEYYNTEIYYNIQSPSGSRDSNLDEYSVEIVWFDSSDNKISTNGVFGDFSNSGGTWEEVSFSKQAPSAAQSAKLKIRAREGGTNNPTVYWDLASLSEFTNQLSNPSFESTGEWDFSDTDVQRSSNVSFDGSFSTSMKDLTQGYDGRILKSNQTSVQEGERYQFGAYYNIQLPSGSRDSKLDEYAIQIVWFNSSNGEISVTNDLFGNFETTTGVWTKDSATAIAPSNATSAELRIRAREGGTNDPTVYWDSAFINS